MPPKGSPRENVVIAVRAAEEGCYEAQRAAALAGIPLSTLYYWAKTQVVVPSISPVRERLWSYADLMALRIVSWLRHPKDSGDVAVPGTTMAEVRRTLAYLAGSGVDLWRSARDRSQTAESPLLVDLAGRIWIHVAGGYVDSRGNGFLQTADGILDLLGPFGVGGHAGPDLLRPRPSLRIVPLKVAGEPHVAGSRITSQSLASLRARGFTAEEVASMYALRAEVVDEALDLEHQLGISAGEAA